MPRPIGLGRGLDALIPGAHDAETVAAKGTIELGLNIVQLPASVRIKALPPGGMCAYAVRLSTVAEIDTELMAWVRAAYQAAG